jgi:hypothetical protein
MLEALNSVLIGPLIRDSRPDANLARLPIYPSGHVNLTETEDE